MCFNIVSSLFELSGVAFIIVMCLEFVWLLDLSGEAKLMLMCFKFVW